MPTPPAFSTLDLPLLTGPELYDSIMIDIEPALLTENLERTKREATTASPEEREELAARFHAAYAEYDQRSEEFMHRWMQEFHTYKRTAMQSLEQELSGEDEIQLQSITSQMSSTLSI